MRNLELYIAVSYLVYLHKVAIYIPPLQAVDGGYAKMDARKGPYQVVVFEGDMISLDILKEGVVLVSGWGITPAT